MNEQETTLFGYTNRHGQHWFASDEYSDKEIESIPDPDGGESTSLPTAIPSPFARLDLVKTAFGNIANTTELRKETVKNKVKAGIEEEKLVSHSLDIAQLLFMSDNFTGKKNSSIEIISWDRNRELATLESGSTAHKRYAATLRLYLDQDKEAYNFDLFETMYLVKFNHEIIGGTSPATLFFCTANDLNNVSVPITGNDRLFDDEYTPLYDRDRQFQMYLYQLFAENPILSKRMKELDLYLRRNLEILKTRRPELYMEILERKGSTTNSYIPLTTGTSGEYVTVLGAQLYKLGVEHAINTAADSDFVIKSTYQPYESAPLVLQNSFNRPLKYVEGVWKSEYQVPFVESDPIPQRTLPHRTVHYPYITVSDMVEPYLIKLPYPIDPTRYYTGIVSTGPNSKGSQYLLPLTTEFFKFFAPSDLSMVAGSNGKPVLEIKEQDKTVIVRLKIPIKKEGEYITFERVYDVPSYGEVLNPDVKNNRGVVVDQNFGMTLFPLIKSDEGSRIGAQYRVQTVDADRHGPQSTSRLKLRFYSKDNQEYSDPRIVDARQRRTKSLGSGGDLGTDYYVVKSNFEYMQVYDESLNLKRGVIIPLWKPYRPGGMKKFKFAIDFGTTNTHIEYTDGDGNPKPFEINVRQDQPDQQIAPLFGRESIGAGLDGWPRETYEMILDEFVPFRVGQGTEYRFPRRTVIAEGQNLTNEGTHYALADYNIPFTYELRSLKGMVFRTNLKWGASGPNKNSMDERLDKYIESIILLLRTKVLLNDGDLASTEIVWFYPTSMPARRLDGLNRVWKNHFDTYFKPNSPDQITAIAESLAPYYHYRESAAILAAGSCPIVNIDIGGGTTDVVVFKQNRPVLQSSFRFAANVLFGDGFSQFGGSSNSLFVSKYKDHYDRLFSANKLEELAEIMDEIVAKGRAQDIHAFFFSISRHKDVKDPSRFAYDIELSKDEDIKIAFVYFFVGIIYHVAKLMKNSSNAIEMPRYVTFSGTGSKVLSIITSNNKMLRDLTKHIFEDVYGAKYGVDGMSLLLEPEFPKEVTCKGGLLAPKELEATRPMIYTTIKGREFDNDLTYQDLENHVPDVVDTIKEFNAYFLDLKKKFGLTESFNISPRSWNTFTEELPIDIQTYVEQALQQGREEADVQATESIAESPFFYGLKGTLYKMTNILSGLNKKS